MAENKIVGYKNIFGFVLPDWVDEGMIRTMVALLLLSVAMLFVLIFVIWPKFEDVKQLKSEVAAKTTQLDSLKSSKAGFDTVNEQIPEVTQNSILQAIPQTYAPENAIFLLRSIADKTTGVIISSYSLPSGVLLDTNYAKSGGAETGKFAGYPVKISISAPVAKMLEFIDKVETSLPVGIVSDLGMQEVSKLSKSVSGEKNIQMDLEITYYQAVLKQVDVSRVTPFSEADLALVKKISGFSRPSTAGVEVPAATNMTGSLFGF